MILIDDSQAVRERLAGLLREVAGVEVVGEAADVAGGIRLLREERPDAMLLDLVLPDGSGFDVLEAIAHEDFGCAAIVLTNFPEPQARRRCLQLGAGHFFDKSGDMNDVIAAVRGMAETRLSG